MNKAPETIYLIPGEYDGEAGLVWCEDPAPSYACDPAEAVEYVRKDVHDEQIAAKCDAPVGWISPEHFKIETDSKMRFFGRLRLAKAIISDLVEHAECNDPRNPHIGSARDFLNGDVK